MAAASPFAYAWLNKSLGITGGMWVSAGLTLVIAGFAVALVRSPRQTNCIALYPERYADKPVQNARRSKHPRYIKWSSVSLAIIN